MKPAALLAAIALAAGVSGAGVSGASADQAGVAPEYLAQQWRLALLGDAAFPAEATLDLAESGRISGQGPCNHYFADQPATLPDFAPGPIGATKMACADLAAEVDFFTALAAMTRAEVNDDGVLVLRAPAGRRMAFTRRQDRADRCRLRRSGR